MNCRFCASALKHVFIDLGNAPASNSFLTEDQLNEPEIFYPLKVLVCDQCFLVQVDEYKKSGAIFDDKYVYFSSFSSSWLAHARDYVDMITERLPLNRKSQIIEIASNDGYLLQNFVKREIPALGIDPTKNTARIAESKGIKTITEFFGAALATQLADQGIKADLLVANNVVAHVPDIVDLVKGMKIILKEHGVITIEFPHVVQLINNNQFDTIYHEHFSYLSLYTVDQILRSQGLTLFDVEELATHGGSLRIYAKHTYNFLEPVRPTVASLIGKEIMLGITSLEYYRGFKRKAQTIKTDFLSFLVQQKRAGKKVAAYGAAAKGNTLLNYCGVKNDLIDFVVDANPSKQSKYLPGSHIPVVNEDVVKKMQPDFLVIFPWNIKEEIIKQMEYVKAWGGRFVVPIPEVCEI